MGKNWSMVDGHRDTTKVYTTSDIQGLDELLRDLVDFADDAMDDLYTISEKAAGVVLMRAQEKAPVADEEHTYTSKSGELITVTPGTLRNSLKIIKPRARSGVYIAMSKVTFGKEAAYAVPVELGHSLVVHGKTRGSVKERPFLRPAADETKDDVIDTMIRSMNQIIEKQLKE
jgi:HK97 gp10 family phage protein